MFALVDVNSFYASCERIFRPDIANKTISGKPQNVSPSGKLTFNKINNEAGLGNSYIHKFKYFIENEANPAIESFNANYAPVKAKLLQNKQNLTEKEKHKASLKKEIKLKEQYRQERGRLVKSNLVQI